MADDSKLDYIQERVDTVVDRVADISVSVEKLKTTFEHHISQDESLKSEFARMADTLSDNTSSLREHMRRTDLLEQYVKSVDARFTPLELEMIRKKAVNSWIIAKLKLVAKLGAAVSALGVLGLAAKHVILFILNS